MLVAQFGWRFAYTAIGASGVFFGLLTLLALREPERGYQIRLAFQQKKMEEENDMKKKMEGEKLATQESEGERKEGDSPDKEDETKDEKATIPV